MREDQVSLGVRDLDQKRFDKRDLKLEISQERELYGNMVSLEQ